MPPLAPEVPAWVRPRRRAPLGRGAARRGAARRRPTKRRRLGLTDVGRGAPPGRTPEVCKLLQGLPTAVLLENPFHEFFILVPGTHVLMVVVLLVSLISRLKMNNKTIGYRNYI